MLVLLNVEDGEMDIISVLTAYVQANSPVANARIGVPHEGEAKRGNSWAETH